MKHQEIGKQDDLTDNVWMNCPTCEEEYHFPEGLTKCPICDKEGLEEI